MMNRGVWVKYFLAVQALWIVFCGVCFCAEEPNSEAGISGPGDVVDVILNSDSINEAIEQIKGSDEIEQEQKDKLLADYEKALDNIARAKKTASQIVEQKQKQADAPAKLKAIEQQLAQIQKEPADVNFAGQAEGASLEELEKSLASAEAEFSSAKKKLNELEGAVSQRAETRLSLPGKIATIKERLQTISTELKAAESEGEPLVQQSRKAALRAEKQALESQLELYENQLGGFETGTELLRRQRDLAGRQFGKIEKRVKSLREVVQRMRERQAGREAEQARKLKSQIDPALSSVAERNAKLASQRSDYLQNSADAKKRASEIATRIEEIANDYADAQVRVETSGHSEAVGLLLRQALQSLPDTAEYKRSMAENRDKISEVQSNLIVWDNELEELQDIEGSVDSLMAGVEPNVAVDRAERIREQGRELLQTQREYLQELIGEGEQYFANLVDLNDRIRQLIEISGEFRDFIDENILWYRSSSAIGLGTLKNLPKSVSVLARPSLWGDLMRGLGRDFMRNPWIYVLAMMLFVFVVYGRARLQARLHKVREMFMDSHRYQTVLLSFEAFLLGLLVTAIWPGIAAFFGWRIGQLAYTSWFVVAVSSGLWTVAAVWITIKVLQNMIIGRIVRVVPESSSLRNLRRVSSWLRVLGIIVLPCSFIVGFAFSSDEKAWSDSLGRLAFILAMLVWTVFMQVILGPKRGVVSRSMPRGREEKFKRTRYLVYAAGVCFPLLMGLIASIGYYYTAIELTFRVLWTLWLGMVLAVIYMTLMSWLNYARRQMAIKEAQKREKGEAEKKESQTVDGEVKVKTDEASIFQLSEQTQKIIRALTIVAVVFGLWFIWADVLPALGVLDQVQLWSYTDKVNEIVTTVSGEQQMQSREVLRFVTLKTIAASIVIAAATIIAAKNAPGLLEMVFLQRVGLEPGIRFAVTAVFRYVITIAGLVMAVGLLGLSWSNVQWLAAAVTFGLGFGLQEIFANFVSGMIILLERPMRVGDTVTVGDVTGTVTRIQIRATTITSWERKELIVPNKEFITGRLINWTLSDTILRVVIPVGIAYGSDTELAHKTLLKVADDHRLVVKEPQPRSLFVGFGDSSLNFELRVYIGGITDYLDSLHSLHMKIDQEFRKAGIEIAFPQQDLHIRTVDDNIPLIVKRDKSLRAGIRDEG